LRSGSLLAALLLSACYSSWERSSAGDASVDPSVEDATADPDADPDGWHFVDRDDPDRNIEVELLFAAVPDVAWNGETAGLVYHGLVSGAGEAVGFIPLDARGRAAGGERILLDGSGLTSAMPRISSAGDGTFLVTLLQESGGDRVVVLRVDAAGSVLATGFSPDGGNVLDPLSPPVRIGDRVYLVVDHVTLGEESFLLYMFSYPDLALEVESHFLPTGECWGDDPLLVKDPVSTDLILMHRCAHARNILAEWLDPDLAPRGATTMFGHVPVTAYHASSSDGGWAGWGFEQRLDVTSLQAWRFDPGGDLWLAPDIEATFYGPMMDSTHAGYPARAGVFAVHHDDAWQVWARPEARPRGWGWIEDLMMVNDGVEARTFEDMPVPAVAWTGGGFLVVWDEWRMETTYSLFSSYIELVPDY
jgi:hypothetical protein